MNALQPDRRHVVILGLDTFARKNVSQIRELEKDGWMFSVITNDQRSDSKAIFESEQFARTRLYVSKGSVLARLRLAAGLVGREDVHHVELYAAGRLTILYLLMLKAMNKKVVILERGDVGCLTDYGPVLQGILRLAYRHADGVIYKETHMHNLLGAFTKAPLFFVPNAAPPIEDGETSYHERSIDFLWANRTTLQRRPEWFVRALQDPRLASRYAVMLGFEERKNLPKQLRIRQEQIRKLADDNIEQFGFVEPEPFYRNARFFCLPSELIFGNNALLEAMAHGAVPVVTQSPGIELLVQNGVNGIVTPLNEHAYREGMVKAAALDATSWAKFSMAAKTTLKDHYSVDLWRRRMTDAYERIGAIR